MDENADHMTKNSEKAPSTRSLAPRRFLGKRVELALGIIASSFSLFYLYCIGFGFVSYESFVSFFYIPTLILGLLWYPLRRKYVEKWPKWELALNIVLMVLGLCCIVYFVKEFHVFPLRAGAPAPLDVFFGLVIMVIFIELSRRIFGIVIPVIALFFIVYSIILGRYLPGPLWYSGAEVSKYAYFIFCTTDGIFGTLAYVMAGYVIPIMIFGAFLEVSGLGRWFINLAYVLTKGSTGGPAKASVISSSLLGTCTGTVVGNVMTTGTFTIPLMKRAGFEPHVAGAVEVASSTGGQIMPPIMGAAAFIIAEWTGTPYIKICAMSILPAILYYLLLGSNVHFYAAKKGLKGEGKIDLNELKRLLKRSYLLVPIAVIVYLLVMGYSLYMAAFWATISTVIVSMISKETRMTPRKIYEALKLGMVNSIEFGAIVGALGIIVGSIMLTGLGLRLTEVIYWASKGLLPIALLVVAGIAYLLGMGMPIVCSYMIEAILTAPALVQLGMPLVHAHLAVFWFCLLADATPPVCVAAFAASSLAGAKPYRIAWSAVKRMILIYIMPFLFAYRPAILLAGSPIDIVETFISLALGCVALAAASEGYILKPRSTPERLLLLASAILLFLPNLMINLIGFIIFFAVLLIPKLIMKRTIKLCVI